MQYQAGVRTVVMGGLPRTGPMQAASGTRGAFPYTGDQLDKDFADANAMSNGTTSEELPQLDATGARDTGMYISSASFNLRDQVRTADVEAQPLQFKYIAADCRLYYTLENVLNLTQLWSDVARAAWTDSSLCVTNSTGFSTTGNVNAEHSPPARDTSISILPDVEYTFNTDNTFIPFGDGPTLPSSGVKPCGRNSHCDYGLQCLAVSYTCPVAGGTGQKTVENLICVPTCSTTNRVCKTAYTTCDTSSRYSAEIKKLIKSDGSTSQKSQKQKKTVTSNSICVPNYGAYFEGLCS